MVKKRGMSLEDKRAALLDIFHETKDVFVLKDIEKLGARRGIVLQSIKDVLQSLVDDDLVHSEKIGISNYFWSFPSEAAVKLKNEAAKLRNRQEEGTSEISKLRDDLEQSKEGKEDSVERRNLERQIMLLEEEIDAKKADIEAHAANDPERYEALKQACSVALDSANRWTDNILTLKSWMKKKFVGMETQIEQFYREQGISDEFDYLEEE